MPTPSIATSAPSASVGQSVTFALSYGDLFLTNFSQKFSSVDSDNQANTSASADGTTATVHNDAVVETGETEALTFATSSAYGENKNYFGFAETHAIIVGNFVVAPGNNLSFNFTSALDLETSVYAPQRIESVSAVRDISFALYDTSDVPERKLKDFLTNLLSEPNRIKKSRLVFFSVSGKLNSSGKDNFLKSQKSENVTFSTELKDSNFEGNQKFASTLIRGSAKYSFNNQANVTLIALRTGEARVAAPETSRSLTLLSTPGSQVVPIEGRRPGAPSNRYSNRKVITYTVGK